MNNMKTINHSLFISTEVAELEANLPCKYSMLVKLVLYNDDMKKIVLITLNSRKPILCMLEMNYSFGQEEFFLQYLIK